MPDYSVNPPSTDCIKLRCLPRIGETSRHVPGSQAGEGVEDVGLRPARREQVDHKLNSDTRACDHGFALQDSRIEAYTRVR